MAKVEEGKKGRGDYTIGDVIDILRQGTALEQYEAARYFPALINALMADPTAAFALSFGHKRADGAEYRIRGAIGAIGKGEAAPEGEEAAVDPKADQPEEVPAEEPEKPAKTGKVKEEAKPVKEDKKPDKPAKESKKPAKDEDDVDALLNQLDNATNEDPEENE